MVTRASEGAASIARNPRSAASPPETAAYCAALACMHWPGISEHPRSSLLPLVAVGSLGGEKYLACFSQQRQGFMLNVGHAVSALGHCCSQMRVRICTGEFASITQRCSACFHATSSQRSIYTFNIHVFLSKTIQCFAVVQHRNEAFLQDSHFLRP